MSTSPACTIVGQPVGQIEGVAKVFGKAAYTADVALPGTLWCKMLRSPYPHARLRRIDVSRARSMPGVHAVITARDLPDVRLGRRMWDMAVLAGDRVRFVGERVVTWPWRPPSPTQSTTLAASA